MSKIKVLVIDDERNFTDVVKINLEASGDFEVQVENNSLSALSTARSFEPDIILLDIVMPGLDGGDLLARFERDASIKNVPIILLTALVSPGDTDPSAVAESRPNPKCVQPNVWEYAACQSQPVQVAA